MKESNGVEMEGVGSLMPVLVPEDRLEGKRIYEAEAVARVRQFF